MRAALFMLIVSLFGFTTQPSRFRLVIDRTSRLIINGSTNVNTFACKTEQYSRQDTIEYEILNSDRSLSLKQSRMVLPVTDFDCGVSAITYDFLEALNYKKYPNLEIQFLSLNGLNNLDKSSIIQGQVRITLSGVEKTYSVDFNTKKNGNESLSLTGKQVVHFGDFGLTPPKKMMGMIQVNEKLEVQFFIKLRPIG